MGPPRRAHANNNTNNNVSYTVSSSVTTTTTASQSTFNAVARYNSNLKVLKRQDPHILSIFDQFTHVCLYHYVDKRWEKRGYEGSMFLFERDVYPPYGFCILNKAGLHDHMQYLQPEDNFDAYGNYVVIQSYPTFTEQRLSELRASRPAAELENLFSPVYDVPAHITTNAQKGPRNVISLWIFGTEQRESMDDVMSRLYKHVKENSRYPDEFRYGPDNPPPLHVRPVADSGSDASDSSPYLHKAEPQQQQTALAPKRPEPSRTPSAIDGLFSKIKQPGPSPLDAQSAPAATPRPATGPSGTRAVKPQMLTIGDIVAKVTAGKGTQSQPASNGGEASPMSGKSLMDTFFPNANGGSSSAPPTGIPDVNSTHENLLPGESAAARVLTNDVISSLLRGGRPASANGQRDRRSDSRSSHSRSSHSNEGDDEESDDVNDVQLSFDDGYSESSTVLDEVEDGEEVIFATDVRVNGHSMNGEYEQGMDHHADGSHTRNGRRIQGDMTPRPPLMPTPPEMVSTISTESSMTVSSTTTIRGHPLVPFQDDSELWPYNTPAHDGEPADDDDQIIELDFADTAALSDPDALYARQRGYHEGHSDSASANGGGGKRSRRERARARDRAERDHIERTWEMPEVLVSASAPVTPAKATNGDVKATNGKGKARADAQEGNDGNKLDVTLLKEGIIAQAQGRVPRRMMEKKEFTSEVLSLFYTDKKFVDDLYNDYHARQGYSN